MQAHQICPQEENMDCWQREIERSRTEAEVVETARDFLALWAPRELEPLTLGWRDLHIQTADDVERVKRWAVDDLAGARGLSALGDYFWLAAARIEEIRSTQRAG
jgi:hypothetical protein